MEYNALHLIYETHIIASVKQTSQVIQSIKEKLLQQLCSKLSLCFLWLCFLNLDTLEI